jgi:ABC-2 type transport system permease protein
MHPIAAITIARLKEFIRRTESVFWVYLFPVLMVGVLGVAFRNPAAETYEIDIVDGPVAESIMSTIGSLPQIKPRIVSTDEARRRLRTGNTALVISSNSEALADENFELEFLLDPTRPGSSSARSVIDDHLQRELGRTDVFTSRDETFDEPGGRYVDFLVPGLLAMGLMGGGLWGVGFAIVDMRIRKLLKRFMATPMKRSHFLMGMMASRLVFMIPQIAILLLFSYLLFGVKVFGNPFSLMLVIFIGAIEFSVIGLLVAARAQTLETVSGLMNMVMLPMYTLCGIFFSYERFPEIVQPLIRLLPLTPLIDALRALMLDGDSIFTLGPELLVMSFWCVVPFGLAMVFFRWND